MVWPFSDRAPVTAESLISDRTGGRTSATSSTVSRSQALRNSTYWAGLRLRADLLSTMPVDIFKRVDGIQVEQLKPPVFQEPGGRECRWVQFVDATQRDLDSLGNTVGLIKAFDGFGKPALIELMAAEQVSVRGKGSKIAEWVIDAKSYDPMMIWHEKANPMAGVPLGLSATGFGARDINLGLAAKEYAAKWFTSSPALRAHLQKTDKTLKPGEAAKVKTRFKAQMDDGDLFVSGRDWEYKMLDAAKADQAWLDQSDATALEVCRYIGVPGDMIDVPVKGSAVTYANITQRNLQLLIINLGPAIVRREEAWSYGLLPQPRYAKINPDAILRMDWKSRYEGYKVAIDSRFMAPSEVRELENRQPFTPDQEAEFARLFPNKTGTPTPATGGTV